MKYSKANASDMAFIEQWYAELERGLGNYTRPADYIDRALRVMNASDTRNRMRNQREGKQGHYNEDN